MAITHRIHDAADVALAHTRRAGAQVDAGAGTSGDRLLSAGDCLPGGYEIRKLIGSGGMGQVFEAVDVSMRRTVAVKVPWPHSDADRLVQEARALAALQHPGVVAIHSIGEFRQRPFLVMERLYGLNLYDHMRHLNRRGQQFTVDEAIDVLIALADVLAAVHQAGIAHFDLKPENVIMAPAQRVVVLDFGVFQIERDLAERGMLYASAYHAAPEIITNRIVPGRGYLVDVYALGIIAFELLTGRPPFRGATVQEVFSQHTDQAPPTLLEHSTDIPAALSGLVDDMLAKDPLERPYSAAAVAAQLRAMRFGGRARSQASGVRVLVVDDDDVILTLAESCVAHALPGAELRLARNGEEALAQIRRCRPDVLVTDLEMPTMNGIELLMYLRGTHLCDATTLIAMTGTGAGNDADLLGRLGVGTVISKAHARGGGDFVTSLEHAVKRAAEGVR